MDYRAALALRPDWTAARKNFAITYERVGRADEARTLWRDLSVDPELHAEALRHLRDLDEPHPGP